MTSNKNRLATIVLIPLLSTFASQAVADDNAILKQGCDDGSWFSCSLLAQELESVGDFSGAATVYETACEFHPGACALLGRLYFEGKGVEQNDERAFNLFEMSCDQDSEVRGCFFAGQMSEAGRGTPVNQEAAVQFFRISCDGGLEAACDQLGL